MSSLSHQQFERIENAIRGGALPARESGAWQELDALKLDLCSQANIHVDFSRSDRFAISTKQSVIVFSGDAKRKSFEAKTYPLKDLDPHSLGIEGFAFAADQKLLMITRTFPEGSSCFIHPNGELKRSYSSAMSPVRVTISSRGDQVMSYAPNGMNPSYASIWPVRDNCGAPLLRYPATVKYHGSPAVEVFSRDTDFVAIATQEGMLFVSDGATVREVNLEIVPSAIVFSPDGNRVFVGSKNGDLVEVSIKSEDAPADGSPRGEGRKLESIQRMRVLPIGSAAITAIAFENKSEALWAAFKDGRLTQIAGSQLHDMSHLIAAYGEPVSIACVNEDTIVMVAFASGAVRGFERD